MPAICQTTPDAAGAPPSLFDQAVPPRTPNAGIIPAPCPSKQLGAAIRMLRRRAGLSQSALAAHFGLTYQQWQKYETGQNRVSAITLQALALHLGIDIRRFFLAFEGYGLVHTPELHVSKEARQVGSLMTTLSSDEQGIVAALAAYLSTRAGLARQTADDPLPVTGSEATARVLLVDDDEDGLHMTAMMLKAEGYIVSLASGGDQAFAALARQRFDAIVSDYAMPGMNGAALLELALERQPGLAAMMITGYATDAGLYKLPDQVSILAKPFTRKDIVAGLQAAMKQRRVADRHPLGASHTPML